jgi:hypothetical protein
MSKTPFACSCFENSNNRFLYHLTINTGHVVQHDLARIQNLSPSGFLPLENRCAEIPGMPGFAFALTQATNCCQFVLAHSGTEVVSGGLAWGQGEGGNLWCWLQDYYDFVIPKIPQWQPSCPPTPPHLPWLAVVISPNIRFISHRHQRLLGAFERELALAIIQASLGQN